MYQVKRENKKLTKVEFSENFSFFPMASNKKVFVIEKVNIKNIMIINHKLAHPLVAKKVQKEYERLVTTLMDLLTSDDDTGENFREALNKIEKFRQEIKNKYRDFLKKQELEDMAKQLKVFQQESQKRYYELQTAIYEISLQQGKGK